jgi:hypothetical protein
MRSTSRITAGPLNGYPPAGTARGSLIGFVVSWSPDNTSITSWTGRVIDRDGVEEPHTVWHLVREADAAGTPVEYWASFLANGDIFTR